MSAKELKLDGGLTTLRVNETEGYLAVMIDQKASRGPVASMLAMLDRGQTHLLLLYLEERLKLKIWDSSG